MSYFVQASNCTLQTSNYTNPLLRIAMPWSCNTNGVQYYNSMVQLINFNFHRYPTSYGPQLETSQTPYFVQGSRYKLWQMPYFVQASSHKFCQMFYFLQLLNVNIHRCPTLYRTQSCKFLQIPYFVQPSLCQLSQIL